MNYSKLQKGKGKMNTGLAISAAGIGYIIAQLILTFVYSESIRMIIFIIIFSLLSIITAFMSIFIHRYFFIVKNAGAVKKIHPYFGLSKKDRPSNQKM